MGRRSSGRLEAVTDAPPTGDGVIRSVKLWGGVGSGREAVGDGLGGGEGSGDGAGAA